MRQCLPRYYGRANVGAIMGAAMPVQMLANAFGPFFGGWVYDQRGGYATAFAAYAAAFGVAATLTLFANPPNEKNPALAGPLDHP